MVEIVLFTVVLVYIGLIAGGMVLEQVFDIEITQIEVLAVWLIISSILVIIAMRSK